MANENIPYKIYLNEDEMPRTWYNVRADMKVKPPRCDHPATARRCRSTICAPYSATSSSARSLTTTTARSPSGRDP